MIKAAEALIDLTALKRNLKVVKQQAPHSKVVAVLKADAYGHGLLRIAQALAEADGLAVARLHEAIELRDAGITQPIMIFSALFNQQDLELCVRRQFTVVIYNREQLQLIDSLQFSQPLAVWLKHDSGMHRLGLDDLEFQQAYEQLAARADIPPPVLMTHFASADEENRTTTERQIDQFLKACSEKNNLKSLANSAAIIQHPDSHYDWVRPGIMLYGSNPLSPALRGRTHCSPPLEPVMTLQAPVLSIRTIKDGESVGYNGRWRASRTSKIATVGIGYADGYPRHAKNGTPVLINGQRAPLVGTVSMDLITIDITECEQVQVGDTAELWGKHLPAQEVARWADTISYQLFTSISKRVPRLYIDTEDSS